MNINLDVDGVLRNMVTPSIQVYKEFYDPKANPKYEDVVDYDLSCCMPLISDYYYLFTKHGKYIFELAKPYVGAVDFVKELKRLKHKVAIVTNQVKGSEKYTLNWLYHNKIPFDSLHFVKDKGLVNGDLLIDDCIDNLISCSSYPVACFDQPWNKEYEGLRFMNYDDALSWIKNYEVIK